MPHHKTFGNKELESSKTECEIDGKRVEYKMCATEEYLESAKRNYPDYKLIGSGYVYYINEVKSVDKKLHYFFK